MVVEPDQEALHLLTDALRPGYAVVLAADAGAALYQLDSEQPDLIILELNLPDVDGILLIISIRHASPVPIIVLSARHSVVDIVTALMSGADDVIGKPYWLEELEARIIAVLRRSSRVPDDRFQYGSLIISRSRGATYEKQPLYLTKTEHKIMMLMVQQGGSPVTHAELSVAIWGSDQPMMYQTASVYMSRLRRRLDKLPAAPKIELIRRVGYRLFTEADRRPFG